MHMTPGEFNIVGGLAANIWIRDGKRYFYCWGADDNGEARLVELREPPYGKTVFVWDGHTWDTETVPFKLRTATAVWGVIAATASALIAVASQGHDPILAKFLIPAALIVCTIAAIIAQYGHLRPADDIENARIQQANHEAYVESQQHAAESFARQQAEGAARAQQWSAAQWAAQASINQALNPGQSTFPPYGQNPPL